MVFQDCDDEDDDDDDDEYLNTKARQKLAKKCLEVNYPFKNE